MNRSSSKDILKLTYGPFREFEAIPPVKSKLPYDKNAFKQPCLSNFVIAAQALYLTQPCHSLLSAITDHIQHAFSSIVLVRKQISTMKILWSDTNDDIVYLLRFCINKGTWSFSMVNCRHSFKQYLFSHSQLIFVVVPDLTKTIIYCISSWSTISLHQWLAYAIWIKISIHIKIGY